MEKDIKKIQELHLGKRKRPSESFIPCIFDIPTDIFKNIFQFLKLRRILDLKYVDKYFYFIVTEYLKTLSSFSFNKDHTLEDLLQMVNQMNGKYYFPPILIYKILKERRKYLSNAQKLKKCLQSV